MRIKRFGEKREKNSQPTRYSFLYIHMYLYDHIYMNNVMNARTVDLRFCRHFYWFPGKLVGSKKSLRHVRCCQPLLFYSEDVQKHLYFASNCQEILKCSHSKRQNYTFAPHSSLCTLFRQFDPLQEVLQGQQEHARRRVPHLGISTESTQSASSGTRARCRRSRRGRHRGCSCCRCCRRRLGCR